MDKPPTKRIFRLLFLLATAIVLVSLAVTSARLYRTLAAPLQALYSPTTLGFEGWVGDSSGQSLTGPHDLTLTLYNDPAATEPTNIVWTETYSDYVVNNGIYSLQMGDNTNNLLPADAFAGDRWVGVAVDTDPEMTPRVAIGSVPFALHARQTAGLLGFPVSTATPQAGQALTFTSNQQWEPRVIHSGVRVTSTTAQSLSSGSVWQAVTFNTAHWDSEGYFHIVPPATTSTHLTAKRPGVYVIFGNIQFTSEKPASFGVRDIAVALNYTGGTTTFIAINRIEAVQGSTATATALAISTIYHLETGETVDLMVLQNSTVALSTVVSGDNSPEFGMEWLGP